MKHEILAPLVGESITEVSILKWSKANGEAVKAGDKLLEIESDKATVEIVAEQSGALTILKQDGERVAVKSVIAFIDDSAQGSASAGPAKAPPPPPSAGGAAPPKSPPPTPAAAQATSSQLESLSPAVRKAVVENQLNPAQIQGSGKDGRLLKGDVMAFIASGGAKTAPTVSSIPAIQDKPGDRRVPMPGIRKRIAERLVFAQHTAAILTTFNEVDMSFVMEVRAKFKDKFKEKHGVNLGFMSFFTKACAYALQEFPAVNAYISNEELIYHDYCDISIAVSAPKGLVVPVIRNAESLSMADIEKKVVELATKARDNKLTLEEMQGGTFTITNGGVFGSLLSTPIINIPQSAILGMHKIEERAVVIKGQIVARPMMYLALSYDHRIIDGKESVGFLVKVKELLENPELLLFGKDPVKTLLEL
jgi:2-oxoglutarate dehydrogenase E2 component (dihydrolipoamide succinyltransferase)